MLSSKDEKLKKAIIKASNDIRKKYKALKFGLKQQRDVYETLHQPLIEPLQEIVKKITPTQQKKQAQVQSSPVPPSRSTATLHQPPLTVEPLQQGAVKKITLTQQKKHKQAVYPSRTKKKSSMPTPSHHQLVTIEEEEDNDDGAEGEEKENEIETLEKWLKDSENVGDKQETQMKEQNIGEDARYFDIHEEYNALPRKYLLSLIRQGREIDKSVYGIDYNQKTNKWRIGDSFLEIHPGEKHFNVKGHRYNGTDGLYQLLTLKRPTAYTDEDLNNYIAIIKATNAYRHGYTRRAGWKYSNIIKPALEASSPIPLSSRVVSAASVASSLKGSSYNDVWDKRIYNSSRNMAYRYWNHPSELIERLKLLYASYQAGHTNHHNEIQDIIEELKEEKIIL